MKTRENVHLLKNRFSFIHCRILRNRIGNLKEKFGELVHVKMRDPLYHFLFIVLPIILLLPPNIFFLFNNYPFDLGEYILFFVIGVLPYLSVTLIALLVLLYSKPLIFFRTGILLPNGKHYSYNEIKKILMVRTNNIGTPFPYPSISDNEGKSSQFLIILYFNDSTYKIDDLKSIYVLHHLIEKKWDKLYQENTIKKKNIEALKSKRKKKTVETSEPLVEENANSPAEPNIEPYYRTWYVYLFFEGLMLLAIFDFVFHLYDKMNYGAFDVFIGFFRFFILLILTLQEFSLIILLPIFYVLQKFVNFKEVDFSIKLKKGELFLSSSAKKIIEKYAKTPSWHPDLILMFVWLAPVFAAVTIVHLHIIWLTFLIPDILVIFGFFIQRKYTPLIWAKKYVRIIRSYEHFTGKRILKEIEFHYPSFANTNLSDFSQEQLMKEKSQEVFFGIILMIPLAFFSMIWFLHLFFSIKISINNGAYFFFYFTVIPILFSFAWLFKSTLLKGHYKENLFEETIRYEFATGQKIIPDEKIFYKPYCKRLEKH